MFVQICLNIDENATETDFDDSNTLDLPQQNVIRDDIARVLRKQDERSFLIDHFNLFRTITIASGFVYYENE